MARVQQFDQAATHRLIPAKYGAESVLETLPLPSEVLTDLSELDAATNERTSAESGRSNGIGPSELLFGVPEANIVNAAFCHPGPAGGRFHLSDRGAWYAGFELQTSVAEVAFHKRRFLREARIEGAHTFDYIDFLADFSGEFHTLTATERKTCLRSDPVPECYQASQTLAHTLLFQGANGIVYPSVRHPGGTCIACFRPALVFHPRRGKRYKLTLSTATESVKLTASR